MLNIKGEYMMADSTHLHITAWVVTFILFFVVLYLNKANNAKGAKIVHMITRLFYIITIISGLLIFMKYSSGNQMLYGIKFLVGLITIAGFEMVLIRSIKGKSTAVAWIVLIVSFLVTFYLGAKLPLGITWFA